MYSFIIYFVFFGGGESLVFHLTFGREKLCFLVSFAVGLPLLALSRGLNWGALFEFLQQCLPHDGQQVPTTCQFSSKSWWNIPPWDSGKGFEIFPTLEKKVKPAFLWQPGRCRRSWCGWTISAKCSQFCRKGVLHGWSTYIPQRTSLGNKGLIRLY